MEKRITKIELFECFPALYYFTIHWEAAARANMSIYRLVMRQQMQNELDKNIILKN